MEENLISQDNPLPIRTQLRDILIRQIQEKKIIAGGKFPSERELAEQYKISRSSVRETIGELIASGVLFRTVGRGTFVAGEPLARSSLQIAFLISEDIFNFAETGYGRILRGVEDACRRHGDLLIFQSIGSDGKQMFSKEASNIDGIVVVGGLGRPLLNRLRESEIPVVLVDLLIRTKPDDLETVNIDYAGGTKMAIERLYELGHRRIGFIGFPGSEKYDSYWQSCFDLGLPYDPRIVEFLHSADLEPGILAGFRAMKKIMGQASLPTAVLATNDYVARGVLEALQSSKIEVPEQVSIIGYDDFGLNVSPTLSTVKTDLEEVGRLAVEALRRRIHGSTLALPIVVPSELIERNSSGIASEVRSMQVSV